MTRRTIIALIASMAVASACANGTPTCSTDWSAVYRATNSEQHRGASLWLRCADGNTFDCDEAAPYDLPRLEKRKQAAIERGMECAEPDGKR